MSAPNSENKSKLYQQSKQQLHIETVSFEALEHDFAATSIVIIWQDCKNAEFSSDA